MVPLAWALEPGIPAHSPIERGIQLPLTTGHGLPRARALLLNPLAPAVSPVRKANRLPVWADSAAAEVWVEDSTAVEWVAEASTAVAEWAAVAFMAVEWVADMVAVAAIANASSSLCNRSRNEKG
jgi:hypothetical protein